MISVTKAKSLVLKNSFTFGVVKLPLEKALGLTLAEDVFALNDVPSFTNSAMDGYAVKSKQTKAATKDNPLALKLIGSVKAGSFAKQILKNKEAIKIMTGAPLPKGADSVVIKEDTFEEYGKVLVKKEVKPGENVRFQGEEIKKGDLALRKFTVLNPAALGFLATIGIKRVKVFKPPVITIIATGDELVTSSEKLTFGKIYDSNSVSLKAALKECGIDPVNILKSPDDLTGLQKTLSKAIQNSDIVLISGGISVGDYDYVKKILKSLKVKEIFWKVAQKPGKPLYFGKQGQVLVFGIPGNPAACLVVFYEYIRPAILKSMGRKEISLPTIRGKLTKTLKKNQNLSYFWRGKLNGNSHPPTVTISEKQGSHMLQTFALGDCLIIGPENITEIKKNSLVEVHLLPWRNKL